MSKNPKIHYSFLSILKTQLKFFLLCTFTLGILYPMVTYLVGRVFFYEKINGSLIFKDSQVIGSSLIGQNFQSDANFQGRPSANLYNGLQSGGTNYSPISKDLKKLVEERKKMGMSDECLFSSGSGLDPHISLPSAISQLDRIAKIRNLSSGTIERLKAYLKMEATREGNSLIFEKPKLNVLKINLLLNREY